MIKLFTTNQEYKKVMTQAVHDIESDVIEPLFNDLTFIGYGQMFILRKHKPI